MKLFKTSVLMAVVLPSAIMMLGILNLRIHPAQGGGGGAVPTASLNGDVNCDGKRNITDAVNLLQHLFSGGPEPCAFAQEATCCPELISEIRGLRDDIASKWTPRPESMVNLAGEINIKLGKTAIYTVPADKYFVLTNINAGDPSVSL